MRPNSDDMQTWRMESRSVEAPRDEDAIATRRAAAASKPSPSPSQNNPLGRLEPGAVLLENCTVIRTWHNHESARPGLFECQAPEGHVMVKVAASDFPPRPKLWNKLTSLHHPNVLRIFRTAEIDGRFYEVQEFCSGGTLEDYVPTPSSERAIPPISWIVRSLIPAFYAGISYLHSQGIVHRDIKPSNVYLRQTDGRATLVLGDFDISSVLQSGRTSRATQRAAGTWTYSAPEAFPRFVDKDASQLGSAVIRSSDYYSFGVVLVELLTGTTSLHLAQLPDLYDFYLQGKHVKVPENLPPRLQELLQGLLCRDRHLRWGGEEVQRWLKNQTTEDDRKRIEQDRGYQLGRRAAPFNAFKNHPTNLSELARAMAEEPQIATDELISSDVLLNWIGGLDAQIARQIRHDREEWREYPNIVLLCAKLRIDPETAFSLTHNRHAHDTEEWAKQALTAISKRECAAEQLCDAEKLMELQVWLQRKINPETEAATRVATIAAQHNISPHKSTFTDDDAKKEERVTPDYRLALEELCWAFLPQRPFYLTRNIAAHTPQQIAEAALGQESEWKSVPPESYVSCIKKWKAGYLEAYLRQRLTGENGAPSPLLQQLQTVRNEFEDKPFVAFETALRLLDPKLPPLIIELDTDILKSTFELRHGEQGKREFTYRAVGRGMPFAALKLHSQKDGLTLDEHEITFRKGHITLRFDARADIPVGRVFKAQLSLVSNTTRLQEKPPLIRYKINYPVKNTVRKIVMGSLAGGAILGATRAILLPFIPHALTFQDAAAIAGKSWPVLFGVLLLAIYGLAQLAFWAMAKHAH